MKIITTVGASIFTNGVKKNPESDLACKFKEFVEDPPKSKWDKFEDSIEGKEGKEKSGLRYFTYQAALKDGYEASAEIKSLIKIAEEEGDIEVVLLATDTVLSVLACELICKWINEYYRDTPSVKVIKKGKEVNISCVFNRDTHVVTGLQVDDANVFKTTGFQKLLELLKLHSDKNTIFNISGGYKAIIPFMTLYGQLEGISLKYIYEESDNLITVGQMPLDFDFSIFRDEYLAFELINPEKKKQNLPIKQNFIASLSDEKVFDDLINSFLISEVEGKIDLSLLGKMLYDKYEKNEKEDGFSSSNLLGKVMEIKVYEFFQKQYPKAKKLILGENIGKSEQGDAYDIDVFVENENIIWAIEVKPQNVDILIKDEMDDKKKKKIIEYKCEVGAFKNAVESYKNLNLKVAVFMYHVKEPNVNQKGNFTELIRKYPFVKWIWVKPDNNYKGNVNWNIDLNKLKEFNFSTQLWEEFKL